MDDDNGIKEEGLSHIDAGLLKCDVFIFNTPKYGPKYWQMWRVHVQM